MPMAQLHGVASEIQSTFDDNLNNSDKPVDECITKLAEFFTELNSAQRLELSILIDQSLRIPWSELSSKYAASSDTAMLIRDLQLRILYVLECKRLSYEPDSKNNYVDDDLSDWLSELLERLSVCVPVRDVWRRFLDQEICSRYALTFGRTICNVYLNLGLEPPDDLPRDDSAITTTTTSPSLDQSENANLTDSAVRSPIPTKSPRSLRLTARKSLPRTMLLDSAVAAAAEALSSSTCPKDTPDVSSSSQSARSTSKQSRQSLATSTPICAPQLVLISSSSTRSRRKCRTPQKRTPLNRSSRRNNRTPPSAKTCHTAVVKRTPPNRCSQSAKVVKEQASKSKRHHRTPKSAGSKLKPREAAPSTPKMKERRYRKSVHETPNPERSHPRWERAKLAAAEKTKNKAIIVDESPIKPAESLGSPLRRLRRANSMLTNLYQLELREANICTSSNLEPSDPLRCSSNETLNRDPDSGCLSRTMSRAEQWCRRQYEEELSLSQYTAPRTSTSPHTDDHSLLSPLALPNSITASGLLCLSTKVRGHNCNLFANMISPEHSNSPPVHSGANKIKTPRKRILCSPQSPRSPVRSPLCTKKLLRTPPLLTGSARLLSASQAPPSAICTPKTTPRRRNRQPASRRQRHFSANGGAASNNPIVDSPQVFGEEAMFLGRDEFLNETNTASSMSVSSPLRTLSDGTEEDVLHLLSSRKRPRVSPLAVNLGVSPPLLRLNSTPKATPPRSNVSPQAVRKGWKSSHQKSQPQTVITPVKNSYPFLNKPECSPYAPLHVFNPLKVSASDGGVVLMNEILETNTTVSSQSASNIVALRRRLFGNSDSNETSSLDRSTSKTRVTKSPLNSPPTASSVDQSRHLWDEASPNVPLSPCLRQLRQRAVRSNSESQSPIKTRRLNFPSLSSAVRKTSIRPRRSLFQ